MHIDMNTYIRPTSFLTRAALTLLLFFVCTLSARSAVSYSCSVTLSTGTNSASCDCGSVSSNGTHVTVSPSLDFSVKSVSWEYARDDESVTSILLSEDPLSGDYIAGGAYGTVTVLFQTETENVRVTFEMSGYGGEAPATQNLTIGQKVTRPTDPTDENYDFVGWFCDAACTTPFDFDVALSYTTPYASYTNSNASASPHFNLVLYAKGRAYVEGYCGKKDATHDGTQLTWSYCKDFPGDDVIDVLTISGNGEMADDAFHSWNLNSVIINEGVTTIGQDAFLNCSGLASITIPSSVTTIGQGAFYGCSGLTSVTIPSSVTTIGQAAFWNCSGLTSVTICAGVTTIGQDAFAGCCRLASITIPSSVTTIGQGAFYECSGLTSVTICAGVTTIGQDAFDGCWRLASITIPSSVTTIGEGAYYGCTGLSSVTIYAPPLATYGERAFFANASGRKIYVYSDFVDDYQAGWPDYEDDIVAIAGATISALPLADNADNATVIAGSDGRLADVTLQGRTLYKDGSWNTLCLPFALTATQTAEMLDNPEALMTLKSTSFEGGTLTLTFEAATAIEAGKPYIVKWSRANDYTDDNAHNLYAPVFPCVPISQATASIKTQYADFVGSYNPVSLAAGDGTVLYLGADNKLYYPSSAVTIGSCRACFELKGGLTAGESATENIRAFVLDFGEETGIREISTPSSPSNPSYPSNLSNPSNPYFTLDGRRLDNPSSPGLYIHGGRKVLIK